MKISVFDGHCDTPVMLWLRGEHLQNAAGHISLQKAQPLGGYVQIYSFCTAWLSDSLSEEERFSASKACFLRELEQNGQHISLCRNADDVQTCLAEGKRGAMLSVEGAEAVSCDPAQLATLYQEGFRMIAPVWNHPNALTGSCVSGDGLTQKGKEFCKEAQSLGFVLDMSHISDRGFYDVCDLAQKPIVASHSNSRSVCPHNRNLTDTQFRLLCQLGGSVGINLFPPFLSPSGDASMDDVYRHIDRFMELGGDGHVALGGDLDGCETLPDGFHDVSDYVNLYSYLQARGYREQTLANLFSNALSEVLKQCII